MKKKIEDTLIYNIGNFTLLEGKNSKNSNKGNFSLSDKSYSEKINTYKTSNSLLTRELAKKYNKPDFTIQDIKKRAKCLANLLNKFTKYE